MDKTHKIGDVVTPNPEAGWSRRMIGTFYRITDLPRGARGVNYKAVPCDADGKDLSGQGLRGPGWSLLPKDSAPAAPTARTVGAPPPPVGSVVAINPDHSLGLPLGTYTVIGHTDHTRSRIVQIGDASGRYYRASNNSLRPLDASQVIAALADL